MSIENIGSSNPHELRVSNDAKGFLKEAARWAQFLSIIGFVMIGLVLIVTLISFAIGAESASSLDGAFSISVGGGLGGVLGLIILLIIYFFPILYMYNFSVNIKKALQIDDEDALTKGFEYLKSHYKYVGILTIILMSIWLIFFLIGIAAAMAV